MKQLTQLARLFLISALASLLSVALIVAVSCFYERGVLWSQRVKFRVYCTVHLWTKLSCPILVAAKVTYVTNNVGQVSSGLHLNF